MKKSQELNRKLKINMFPDYSLGEGSYIFFFTLASVVYFADPP